MLIKGADWLVEGAGNLARRFGVSPLFIGLTVVAFGTSAPELAVSLSASFNRLGEIALSNVVGSNIANVGLIIGISAIILPLSVESSTVRKEIPFALLISAAVFTMIAFKGNPALSIREGVILLLFFAIFFEYLYSMAKSQKEQLKNEEKNQQSIEIKIGKNIFLTTLGIVLVVIGGKLVVNSASFIASFIGMSDAMIGLTIVAVGTSLPELVTSVTASLKKEMGIAIGNVVGSNIFNLLLVLGLASIANPVNITMNTYWIDLLVMLIFMCILMIFSTTKMKITRVEGSLLLLGYLMYIVFAVIRG
ncbi:MAG: calcium/sodium antiporter [Kosmotoga sp.]|nr:MAG: calcium/sodium antiporter [Kosmotoga sp.]